MNIMDNLEAKSITKGQADLLIMKKSPDKFLTAHDPTKAVRAIETFLRKSVNNFEKKISNKENCPISNPEKCKICSICDNAEKVGQRLETSLDDLPPMLLDDLLDKEEEWEVKSKKTLSEVLQDT